MHATTGSLAQRECGLSFAADEPSGVEQVLELLIVDLEKGHEHPARPAWLCAFALLNLIEDLTYGPWDDALLFCKDGIDGRASHGERLA